MPGRCLWRLFMCMGGILASGAIQTSRGGRSAPFWKVDMFFLWYFQNISILVSNFADSLTYLVDAEYGRSLLPLPRPLIFLAKGSASILLALAWTIAYFEQQTHRHLDHQPQTRIENHALQNETAHHNHEH